MFTGLIEEIGSISAAVHRHKGLELVIDAHKIIADLTVNDSVAVNGVCLTVVARADRNFTVQAVEETMQRTTLATLQRGDRVNLERALLPSTRLGGHFVQGHVDGTGVITSIDQEGEGRILELRIPRELAKYCVPKGSIAVDGVSLTIAEIRGEAVRLWLIPHTLTHTTLGEKGEGDSVNVEVDILGKYIFRIGKSAHLDSTFTEEQLKEWGY